MRNNTKCIFDLRHLNVYLKDNKLPMNIFNLSPRKLKKRVVSSFFYLADLNPMIKKGSIRGDGESVILLF